MRILGVDPGMHAMGWGVLEQDFSASKGSSMPFKVQGVGCIKPPRKANHAERLLFLYQELSAVVVCYAPTVLVLERIFVNKYPASALVLGYARAVAMLIGALHDLKCAELSATSVKQSITGHGHASKAQMTAMIERLLNIPDPLSHDSADALALALCYGLNPTHLTIT